AHSSLTVTMAAGYPMLKKLTSTGVPCVGTPCVNAIVVKQQADVPTYFARVLGINSVSLSATATAGAKGGKSTPVDVMIILDATQSMTQTDSSCSGQTKMNCALAGVRALLSGFWPSVDQVGLMVYPGLTPATPANYEYDCDGNTPAGVANPQTTAGIA